jgi:hypothetical protein
MTRISIPTGTDSYVYLPAKAEPKTKGVERIGFSPIETAESIGVSESLVFDLIKTGKIRVTKIGKRVIVSVQSLRDFIDGKKEPCDSGTK